MALQTTDTHFAAETAETADAIDDSFAAPAVPVPTSAPFKPSAELVKLGKTVHAECERYQRLMLQLTPDRLKALVAEKVEAAIDDPDKMLLLATDLVAIESAESRNHHILRTAKIYKARIREAAERARPLIIAKAEHDLAESSRVLAQYVEAESAAQAAVGVTGAETSPVVMRLSARRDANRSRLEQWLSGELKVQWGELASLIG